MYTINVTYLGLNLGRQIGIQASECLNDSVELTRLRMMCRSAGCSRYFFILARVTSWLSATRTANTTGGAGADFLDLPPEQAAVMAPETESLTRKKGKFNKQTY